MQRSILEIISLRVATQPRAAAGFMPRHRWLFAAWMAAGCAIAVFAGLVLGILAAVEVSIGGDRWTQAVQAHGRLQLFGFIATFVVALAFEFLPRLNQQRPFPSAARAITPALLAVGSVLMAAGEVWHESAGVLMPAGAIVFAAGAAVFAVLTWRVPLAYPVRLNPQPYYLRAAAAWLAASAAIALWGTTQDTAGVFPLAVSAAIIEVFLRGFIMLMVVGIALRAFVGHLSMQPMSARSQLIFLAAINGALVLWLASLGLGALPEWEPLTRLADAAYAVTILALTWHYPILRGLRRRPRERYELLVPVAWLGVVAYALLLLVMSAFGSSFTLYQTGAIRHVFLLGFMLPLMLAMAHIVLERFGTGRIPRKNWLTAGFWLLVVAWPLRVLPALFTDAPAEAGQWVMALAGVLTAAAIAAAAVASLSVVAAVRRETAARGAR